MDLIYETELALLRSALWGEAVEIPAGIDWAALTEELRQQTVLGLVSGIEFPEGSVPESVRKELERVRLQQGAQFYRYMDAQEQVLELLRSNGIRTVVLKGSAAAAQYPDPELRTMGDIDLLVAPEEYERAITLLKDHGYLHRSGDTDDLKHIEFVRDGFSLELHRSFGDFLDPDCGEIMKHYLMKGLENAQIVDCSGSAFPMLPPLENGLILLRHIARHIGAGIGFRQIIDWMMYVHSCLRDERQAEKFLTAAGELQLAPLASATTALCRRYLGLPDDCSWCGEVDEGLSDRYMEYILACGNWGSKKDKVTLLAVSHMAHIHNPLDLFRQLQWSGLSHWRGARENRVLRPFAWIYGAGRFLLRSLGRKNALSQLREEADASRDQKRLLDDLGVVR